MSSSVSGARSSVAGGAFGPPQIAFDEINLLEEIGRGYFGIVYRAIVRGCEVAVKVPHREVSNPAQFMREVNVLSKLFHPNVCLFMGACLTKKVMIVSELMKGDVETLLLNKENKFKLSELISMALDAAKGMAWLHGNNPPVYHRDLKIANLLYDDSMKIKVCDFGLADIKPSEGRELFDLQPKGTPLYMAPEVMLKEPITEKADIFSFAIVMWEIFTRSQAYGEFKDFRTFKQATISGNRPQIPDHWPEGLKSLISKCWDATPSNRPTFEQIVRSLEELFTSVEHNEYEVAIDEKILDDTARNFWKKHFLKFSEIPWREFEPKLLEWLDIHLPPASDPSEGFSVADFRQCQADEVGLLRGVLAMKTLFASDGGASIVTTTNFGKVTECFGPLEPDILQRITDILRDTAFHGFLSTSTTDGRLSAAEHGTYLIRFSNNRPKSLIISQVTVDEKSKKTIRHIVVAKSNHGGWVLDKRAFRTIPDLLERAKQSYSFLHPLPCQNFFYLFEIPGDVDYAGYRPDKNANFLNYDELDKLTVEDNC